MTRVRVFRLLTALIEVEDVDKKPGETDVDVAMAIAHELPPDSWTVDDEWVEKLVGT